MLAVVKARREKGVDVTEVPSPRCGAGEVIIEVQAAGICGSDLHVYEWTGGYEWMKIPVVLGHEFSGTIAEVGPGVDRFRVGARVSAEPAVPCGRCFFCRTGRFNICENRAGYGLSRDGAFAKYTVFPEQSLYLLPEEISFEEAACLEPLGVALHAVEVSLFKPGDMAMVLGPGPIGLYLGQILAGAGAHKVLLAGLKSDRLRLEAGAKLAPLRTLFSEDEIFAEQVRAATEGRGPDVVFDCSGSPQAAAQAVHLVRAGGQVVWVSIFPGPVPVDGNALVRREVSLQSSRSRVPSTWFRALRLLADKKVRVLDLVTHRASIREAPQLFETLSRREGIKGLILPAP